MSRFISKSAASVSLEETTITDNSVEKAAVKAIDEAVESPVENYDSSENPETLSTRVKCDIDVVKEGQTEIENVVKSLTSLDNVAVEMMNIMAEKGRMTSVEAMLVGHIAEHAVKVLPKEDRHLDLPSFESYHTPSRAGAATEVSLEGIGEKILTAINNFFLSIEKNGRNLVGLARSFTPLIGALRNRAAAVRNLINDSNREAGKKEFAAKYAGRLAVDGTTGDAGTVLKTAEYTVRVANEFLGKDSIGAAEQNIKQAVDTITKGADKEITQPHWLWLLVFNPEMVATFSQAKIAKQIKVNGDGVPQWFKTYPSIARVNYTIDNPVAERNLDIKRSEHLFGGKALAVSQYKSTVEVGAGRHIVPKVTLVTLTKEKGDKTLQTLTAKEQMGVLNRAIEMLDVAEAYFKDFAKRNDAHMKVWQTTFRRSYQLNRSAREDAAKSVQTMVIPRLLDMYTRLYWLGIFKEQAKFAMYLKDTASALISYADDSRRATQANTGE